MADNTAAYLVATKAPLEVKPAPRPVPKDNEIVIRTRALAINPVDWATQDYGPEVFTFITLPHIPVYDVAGEVTAVGAGAGTRFRVGDRVAGLSYGGAQAYAPLAAHLATRIPAALAWERAAVLPMGTTVGIKALFHKDYLALDLPVVLAAAQDKNKKKGLTVLIGGGAGSVGSCTVQLAVAAGYDVISTASPGHAAQVRALGARAVVDHTRPTFRADLVAAARGATLAGAVANGGFGMLDGSGPGVVDAFAAAVRGGAAGSRRFVALTMAPTWGPSAAADGVEMRFVEQLRGDEALAAAVFHGYLGGALAEGSFTPLPGPEVVGHGLGAVQGAMDTLRKGVSGKKLVVTM